VARPGYGLEGQQGSPSREVKVPGCLLLLPAAAAGIDGVDRRVPGPHLRELRLRQRLGS